MTKVFETSNAFMDFLADGAKKKRIKEPEVISTNDNKQKGNNLVHR